MFNSDLPDAKSGGAGMPMGRSLGLALFIEAILLFGAVTLIAQARANATANEPPMKLVEVDNPPPPATPPPPKQVKEPVRQPVPHPVPLPRPQPVQPEPIVNPAPPVPSVVAAPPAPEKLPPPRDNGDREAEFAARLKASIQAAVVYPAAAKAMGFSGRARLEFQFRDGVISHLKVVQTSGSGLIDQAAMASVGNAVVPPIPDFLKGRDLTYQVTVEFQLKSER